MIRHEDVGADPCAVLGSLVGKPQKTFVHKRVRENLTATMRTGGDEVSRCAQEYEFETLKARFAIFGGHRPPLQSCPQSREKLLMDIVEAAVAENHDHIFWPEHRDDSVDNRVRILLVERRPAGLSDRRNDTLRI